MKNLNVIEASDVPHIRDKKDLIALLEAKGVNLKNIYAQINYDDELRRLQVELVKLQHWIRQHGMKVAILFEGRDAAGKGGTIRRFTEHLNPRSMRVVALAKPSEIEKGQWYFRRYIKELPNPGEMVFFDRSWYNRAVVEPVMGFCRKDEYERFMQQVPEFEHMLYEDGTIIIKFWFSISKEEQLKRFKSRKTNPLKQWKLSPVDEKSQSRWDAYTTYKERMFSRTHTEFAPWTIVKANNKLNMRLESIRYVLSRFEYDQKDNDKEFLFPDPNIVQRYYRSISQIDQ